ncbi:MAG: hypothetical protein ACRC4M_05935 [Mycoplasma sp.]
MSKKKKEKIIKLLDEDKLNRKKILELLFKNEFNEIEFKDLDIGNLNWNATGLRTKGVINNDYQVSPWIDNSNQVGGEIFNNDQEAENRIVNSNQECPNIEK